MVKAIMHGCGGRMGSMITDICAGDPDIGIVAGIDVKAIEGRAYPVFDDISKCDVDADVIIDCSQAGAADALIDYVNKKNIPVVICTTGLSEEQLKNVEEISKKTAVLRSANMSLGVNILLNLLKTAAASFMPAGFDAEIVEKHHNQKLDAPSGTALALADAINSAADNKYSYNFDRSKERKKREKYEIGISAVRGGNIVGEHEIFFCGLDEVVELKHTAYSRAVLAKGAVEAGKFLAGKPAGMYDMQDVIKG